VGMYTDVRGEQVKFTGFLRHASRVLGFWKTDECLATLSRDNVEQILVLWMNGIERGFRNYDITFRTPRDFASSALTMDTLYEWFLETREEGGELVFG